jgi:hypothetical protein
MMFKNNSCSALAKRFVPLLVSTVLLLLAQWFTASPARAECVYEDETYQTGDTVGSLVCMPDGTWQPQ